MTRVIAFLACSIPCGASGAAHDRVALGIGLHAAIDHVSGSDGAEALSGGAQVRLKLARYLCLRVDFDFDRDQVADVESATTLQGLVPYPDLRASLGLHPLPNRYLSPWLALGAGANSGTGLDVPVLLGGLGLETTLGDHLVLGASWQVFYGTPGRYSRFRDRQEAAGQSCSVGEMLVPRTYLVVLEVTYFL